MTAYAPSSVAIGRCMCALDGPEWFVRRLIRLLSYKDAIHLALVAIECDFPTLQHALCHDASRFQPLSVRLLLIYAAERGWWNMAAKAQPQCTRTRHQWRGERGGWQVKDKKLASWVQVQQIHRVELPAAVMYAAAKRGQIEEARSLHSAVDYDAATAIECATESRSFGVVQWLLDHYATAVKRGEAKDQLKTVVRLEDSPFGVICWYNDTKKVAYCLHERDCFLPPREGDFDGGRYPFMDWAAERGDISLLQRLHDDSHWNTTCSDTAMVNAAGHGYLDVIKWLHDHRTEHAGAISLVFTTAAKHGQVEVMDWICHHYDPTDSVVSAIEEAVGANQFSVLRWLFARYKGKEHRPRWVLTRAVVTGSIEMVRYLYEEEKYKFEISSARIAARFGHFDLFKWMIEADRRKFLSHPASYERLLHAAASGGNVELVKWCMEGVGPWYTQVMKIAAEKSHVDVLDCVFSKASERGVLSAPSARDHLNYEAVNAVDLVFAGASEASVLWVLQHFPETEPFVLRHQVARFSSRHRPFVRRALMTWSLTRAFLEHRPQFCRHVPLFPVWTVKNGTLDDLERLEAIKHPALFTRATLDTILQCSRDDEIMKWFLLRCQPSLVNVKVASWIAMYGVIQLLPVVQASILETTTSDPRPKTETARMTVLGSLVWSAIRHDQVCVLQWVSQQYYPVDELKRVWRPQLVTKAQRRGRLLCLLWLQENCSVVIHNSQKTG